MKTKVGELRSLVAELAEELAAHGPIPAALRAKIDAATNPSRGGRPLAPGRRRRAALISLALQRTIGTPIGSADQLAADEVRIDKRLAQKGRQEFQANAMEWLELQRLGALHMLEGDDVVQDVKAALKAVEVAQAKIDAEAPSTPMTLDGFHDLTADPSN